MQRSYDGQHFENIGKSNAAGTTYLVNKYSFTDYGILNSGKPVVYYRLNAIDNDGKSAFSNVISLRIKGTGKWSLHLLSNPVTDYVSLMVTDVSGKLKLSIIDESGRILYIKSMENVSGQITLPVMLQKGIYLLEAKNNNDRKIIKFIK